MSIRIFKNLEVYDALTISLILFQPSLWSFVIFLCALIVVSLFLNISCLFSDLIIFQKIINPSLKGLFESLSKTIRFFFFLLINETFGYIKFKEYLSSVNYLYSLCQVKLLSSIQVLFFYLYFID